jgi:site-specific recombinase XerD
MPTARFNLQEPKEPETYVRLVFRYDGRTLRYYTGDKIRSDHWNATEGRARKVAGWKGWQEFNANLGRLAGYCEDIYRRYRYDGKELTTKRFKQELDAVWKNRTLPDEKAGAVSLFDFIEQLITERKGSPNYSAGSVKVYRTTLLKLRAFAEAKRRRLDFEHIDLDFHADFLAWMNRQGFSPNYIHKVVSTLKNFLGEAADRGYNANNAFRSARFTVRKELVEHIYLTEEEVERLAALDLSGNVRLERVRDLFLIGCYTGLRFSDFTTIKPENIVERDGVHILTIIMRKTRGKVSVPLLPGVLSILERYGGEIPKALSNQKMNEYLKELGRMAGINEAIPTVRMKGGLRVDSTVKKHALISTHTARRSFATNEYLRAVREGRSYRPIMEILGHKKESTFFGYIKVSAEENAMLFAADRGRAKAG